MVYFAITAFYGDSENNHPNVAKPLSKDENSKPVVNTQELNVAEPVKSQGINNSELSEEIRTFNEFLVENFRPNGSRPSIKLYELRKLADLGVKAASKLINEMAQNPRGNLLALLELNYQCSGLLTAEIPLEVIFKNRSFEKSLWNSGHCSRFGTESDPFFDHLQLARQGDNLAQLTLNGELFHAIERGIINPRLNPIEYNDLRNEVAGYLKDLSAQGVGLASLKLRNE